MSLCEQVQQLQATSQKLQSALDQASTLQPGSANQQIADESANAQLAHDESALGEATLAPLPSPGGALTGLAAELKVGVASPGFHCG